MASPAVTTAAAVRRLGAGTLREGDTRHDTRHNAGTLREGDRVEARFHGSSKHYPGIVLRDNRDGTYGVAFDDGDRERAVPNEHIVGGAENNTGMMERMEAEQRRLEARRSSEYIPEHAGRAAPGRGVVGRGRQLAGRAADRYDRWAGAHPRAANVLGTGALAGAAAARVLLSLL
jgi:hypothetical protein